MEFEEIIRKRTSVRKFSNKKLEKIYLIIYIIMVFLGAIIKVDFIWYMADVCNALMAIPNLIALIYLSDIVSKETN